MDLKSCKLFLAFFTSSLVLFPYALFFFFFLFIALFYISFNNRILFFFSSLLCYLHPIFYWFFLFFWVFFSLLVFVLFVTGLFIYSFLFFVQFTFTCVFLSSFYTSKISFCLYTCPPSYLFLPSMSVFFSISFSIFFIFSSISFSPTSLFFAYNFYNYLYPKCLSILS